VRQSLGLAVAEGEVLRNVAGYIEMSEPERKPVVALTEEGQAARFIAAAKAHLYGPIFRLAISSGLRMGELLGLKWGAVDLTPGKEMLSVVASLSRAISGKTELREPKAKSARTIPLSANVVALEALHDQRRALMTHGIAPAALSFVFSMLSGERKGEPLRKEFVSRHSLVAILVAAGLQEPTPKGQKPKARVRFHALRHTVASLVAATTDLKTAGAFLGHSNLNTTQRYLHTSEARLVAAGGALSAALAAGVK
jgi:integrase